MRFGPVPLAEAEGAILAHSLALEGGRLRKGLVLTAEDLARIADAGFASVTVARLDPGDVAEDAAAARLAAALAPDPQAAHLRRSDAFTGRVNLHAVGPGIVALDAGRVHALNRIDPAITLATLPPHARVAAGTLVGTVKIISYGVEASALAAAEAVGRAAIRVLPVVRRSAGLLLTESPGQEPKLAAKGRRAVEARLAALGMTLAGVMTTAHDAAAMAAALAALPGEMLLILTGSATSDLFDTGPEAVRAAGGSVARFGMPVDPGNLLFHGRIGQRPVIGLPGCARSPALNGADWVLERLACGLELTDDDIAAMGVGGLLKEIPTRPQPREARDRRG
ncbi:molybdopterin biosynthesis protein [Cereibacter changlensis JA139]|uniref:Molybdopterin biosynthesis protein n=2 Tax=Cereibacter changlensis TaxID=402884 RepID=A0A2T4JVB3_9RHOB|nr:molybdopterin-binding protein [Cereibacter changlensis]PTE21703.1 molybdopterin biosynthesis protein [Cereibacter changlensis JA139]PZX57229.1 molybdenum cofactor cytidylyltransferase [Cereibacter changlensis]